jgi:hypothetical protein
MTRSRLVEAALRCYPSWWRQRHLGEVHLVVADLLAEGRHPIVLASGLLRGALRTRTRAIGMPIRYDLWSVRTKMSVLVATVPWLVVGPMVLYMLGDPKLHSSVGPIVPGQLVPFGSNYLQIWINGKPPRPAPPVATAAWVATYSAFAMGVLFLLLWIVLLVGWRRMTAAIRRSGVRHRLRTWLLAWVPGIAVLGDIGLLIAKNQFGPHGYSQHGNGPLIPFGGDPAVAHALGVALWIVAIGGWIGSLVCVSMATTRAALAPEELQFGKNVANLVALLLGMLFVSYTTWIVALHVQRTTGTTIVTLAYAHESMWMAMLGGLALVVAVSVTAARVAGRSWRVALSVL